MACRPWITICFLLSPTSGSSWNDMCACMCMCLCSCVNFSAQQERVKAYLFSSGCSPTSTCPDLVSSAWALAWVHTEHHHPCCERRRGHRLLVISLWFLSEDEIHIFCIYDFLYCICYFWSILIIQTSIFYLEINCSIYFQIYHHDSAHTRFIA